MKHILLASVICFVSALAAVGQITVPTPEPTPKSAPIERTKQTGDDAWLNGPVVAETTDLTDGKPCGDPRFVKSETLTGWVVRRQFADDETTLNGVVIRDKKDERTFVNVDADFLKAHGSGAYINSLSDVLLVDKYVRVKADVCGKIYLMRRVKRMKG